MSPKKEFDEAKKVTTSNPQGVKREAEGNTERTVSGRYFTPAADIFETEKDLVLMVDMPGVPKDRVNVRLDNDELEIEGQVVAEGFEKMQVLFSEYNIGNYFRRFSLSNEIQKDSIEAVMSDGVLTLRLPKTPRAQPRKIAIS
jgi:HSP20 family protein